MLHFDHQRRKPGDLIKVEREQFENERGQFECPRWAVLDEPKICVGKISRREGASLFGTRATNRPEPETEVDLRT